MKLVSCASLLALGCSVAVADPVKVTGEQKTHACVIADCVDDGSQRAMYPKKDTFRTNDITFPRITLNNGAVEVKIVPTLGARILDTVHLKSGLHFAGFEPEKEPFKDALGFAAGWTEASFPYFEHGVGICQPATWRILANAARA